MGSAQRVEHHGRVERLHMSRAVAGRPLQWTSVYGVDGVLVDSGCSSARPVLRRWLKHHPVHTVLTTHEHEDHIGNHAILPEAAQVHAPALAARFLAEGHPPFPRYRGFVWGYHERARGAAVVGERVDTPKRRFLVVETNGHSMDHVAYLDEADAALYSGDAYMGKFRAARLEEDVHTGIRSLRRMAELDAAVLYPAHGPVVPRPRHRLIEVAEHFEDLARKAHRLHERGLSHRRIHRLLLGGEPALTYISLGEFSGAKLIANLLREPAA